MAKKFPILPAHPERICWGCDRYCPADAMMCGNGSVATLHPSELFGEDWQSWGLDAVQPGSPSPSPSPPSAPSASAGRPEAPRPHEPPEPAEPSGQS